MTRDKQLKARIRARMAKTGERYTTARFHLLGDSGKPAVDQVTDLGYALRGGVAADPSAVTNTLANIGVRRSDGSVLSEPLLFAASGGIGALYILWEFKRHDAPVLTLGFNSRPQYPREWLTTTLNRLDVPYETHTTSGAKSASARLSEELDAGRPVIVLP
ncbi:MAG TPA: BtrH N-terminal domain-containing protein, partial [Acidothermales bacterium]